MLLTSAVVDLSAAFKQVPAVLRQIADHETGLFCTAMGPKTRCTLVQKATHDPKHVTIMLRDTYGLVEPDVETRIFHLLPEGMSPKVTVMGPKDRFVRSVLPEDEEHLVDELAAYAQELKVDVPAVFSNWLQLTERLRIPHFHPGYSSYEERAFQQMALNADK